jgi:indolepyruvate ferredoxin oxidoreductase alpha subunit
MGSSIGMAIGAAHAGMTPSLCVIGDGTFTHSGLAPLLDAVRDNSNIKVFILDNSIVAMTGGQPTMATDEEVVDLVAGLGVRASTSASWSPRATRRPTPWLGDPRGTGPRGLSVIIARRACVTYAKEIKNMHEDPPRGRLRVRPAQCGAEAA